MIWSRSYSLGVPTGLVAVYRLALLISCTAHVNIIAKLTFSAVELERQSQLKSARNGHMKFPTEVRSWVNYCGSENWQLRPERLTFVVHIAIRTRSTIKFVCLFVRRQEWASVEATLLCRLSLDSCRLYSEMLGVIIRPLSLVLG